MSWTAEQHELREPQADSIAERLFRKERVLVQGGAGSGKSSLVHAVASRLGGRAIVVSMESALDGVQSAILSAAQQVSPAALYEVDQALALSSGEPTRALEVLTPRLEDRLVIVDDADQLLPRVAGNEVIWAFAPQADALHHWFQQHADLMTFERPSPKLQALTELGDAPPCQLRNGADIDTGPLWDASERNPLRFRLGLNLALLTECRDVLEAPPASLDQLRSDAWDAMPLPLQELVAVLAVHGRPLARSLLCEVLPDAAESSLLEARRTLLADVTADTLVLPTPWVEWIQSKAPSTIRSKLHRRLAEAFEQAAPDNPLFTLEAHRHFLGAGDTGKAGALARFGPALMLAHARDLSVEERNADAARIYEFVLDMDASIRAANGAGIGPRPRAYARHYFHYNRSKAQLESPKATERGFVEALADWPQNALFWSRLVVKRFILGDFEGAVAALQDAHRQVPEHPEKRILLVTQTISKLLLYSRVEAAIAVWGSREAQLPHERTVLDMLLAKSRQGWVTTDLRGAERRGLFHRLVRVTVNRVAHGYACSLVELDITGRGPNPTAAIDAALQELMRELSGLSAEFTHTLPPDRRLRKRTLMSWVDIVRSGIAATPRTWSWVLGRIEQRDGQLVLVVGQETIPVPSKLGAAPGEALYLARVPARITGEPNGPVEVLELASPDDPDRIWDDWDRLAYKA